MRTVLVTGLIGSGKSEVCRHLVELGYPVYDCDSRCKSLYEKVPGLKTGIEAALGIPFSEIGTIFTDEAKRVALESIVYPLLLEDIRTWKSSQESDLCFIESAVALEKPAFDSVYDSVLVVRAPYGLRLARNPRAAERNALQTPPEGDFYYIDNDKGIDELYKQTDNYLTTLL